jgi:retron-type reverse transcriptase
VDELTSSGKPFEISKRTVWEAWEKVRANKGAAGVDGVSIEEFEKDLRGNLYKIVCHERGRLLEVGSS